MDFGPVFWWEGRRAARRWPFYAARSGLVGVLLVGLAAIWLTRVSRLDLIQAGEMAKAGEWFFDVIAVGQVSLMLFAAPAATAGAFCTQRVRGHLGLMLVTGIRPAEIVFGTLCARLLTVLATASCIVPMLALGAQIGGMPHQALLRLEVVTMGCAVVGCAIAVAFSVEAHRLHEALMGTYVVLLGWVLGYPILIAIQMTSVGRFVPAGWSGGSLAINPYALVLQPIISPSSYHPEDDCVFLVSTLALALAVGALASWRLSPALLTSTDRVPRRSWLPRFPAYLPFASIDAHPVLWRECRLRPPTGWLGLLWAGYLAGALAFTALAVGESTMGGVRRTAWTGPFNGFQSAVGLLLLSLVSPASLAEDRARGSLDLLLASPLSTRSLILSKWCACYRGVPALALLPTLVALAQAVPSRRWAGVLLVFATVLAHAAAVTSLGIALATWLPRIDRVLIVSAAASVLVTAAWVPSVVVLFGGNQLSLGLATASPVLGVGVLTTEVANASARDWPARTGWAVFWILAYVIASISLLLATLASFDRCLGRGGNRSQVADGGGVRGRPPRRCRTRGPVPL
jgi:hypothetical protein